MNKNCISIIVPIYKTEKYLEKCIESILAQTYKNIEVILINDGSPDESLKICREYEKKDDRIKVVDQPNSGISSVRNTGLKIATGEYIGFVDSDDYVDVDMFETLIKLAQSNDADISMVSYKEILDGKIVRVPCDEGDTLTYNKFTGLNELLINLDIENYVWNKLYRKDILDNFEFPIEKKFEDIEAMAKIFERANKIVYKREPKYNYIKRSTSTVNTYTYESLKDYVLATEERYNYLTGKYMEVEPYNALAFISNMVIVYRIGVIHNIPELLDDFERNYDLFVKLVNENEKVIFGLIGNYKRVLLSIILWDRKYGKEVIKEYEKQKNNKRKEEATLIQ